MNSHFYSNCCEEPRCGTPFDENNVPPWTRGDFRGGWKRTHPGTTLTRTFLRAIFPLQVIGFETCGSRNTNWFHLLPTKFTVRLNLSATPSPVCGERVGKGRVRGRCPTEANPRRLEVARYY